LASKEEELRSNPNISESEVEDKMKDEKMMIALEKMKLASKRKVAIKVFNNDGSNKTVVVEEGMSAAVVCYLLVTKNHFEESPNWTIIERLGDVNLERELEDHESVESIYTHWARDSNNQFLFRRNNLKYEIFTDPIKYFPALLTSALIGKEGKNQTDKARKILVQEYFTSALRVPEIEGHLHLKDGYKNKSWKKIYVILRASGLYQTLKGKAKTAQNLKLLVQFEDFDMYRGMNFKKMLKAPTDFCFAFRPKPDQVVPGAKDIKVLCAESEEDFLSWFGGCRLAKYGHTLYDNYYKAHIKQFKLEDAGQQSDISAEQRAYSLSGMRLEKHLDKRREEYQREKEATKAQEMMFKKVADQQDSDEGSPSVPPKVAPKPKPKPTRQEHQPSPPLNGGGRVQDDPVSIDDLSQYPWYHGSIPRDEAIRRLEQAGVKDG
jgi:amyloid beta A4 precursor protein-binding family B protein 1-interacting protein